VAPRHEIDDLKRRVGRRLLRTPGVVGVGTGRARRRDDYVLVVYLARSTAATRDKVKEIVGPGQPVRLVRSGPFRPR
jgi:hypothetical protein